jgi:hypothetical protein
MLYIKKLIQTNRLKWIRKLRMQFSFVILNAIVRSNDPAYEVYDGVIVQDDFLNAVTAIKTVD